MLNVTFELDDAGFASSSERYLRDGLAPALVDAVNRTAAQVARGIGGFLESGLAKADAFTLAAGGWLPANADNDDPAALVFLRRRQAAYLGYEVYGGTRVAGDPGTLPGGVLVPMRDSVMDANGNLDFGALDHEMADPRAHWVALGPEGDQVLVQSTPGGGTLFLAGLVPEAHYDPTLDFYGWAERESLRIMAGEVGGAIEASQA